MKTIFPITTKFLQETFGEHFESEMILDYLTILRTMPFHKLPIITLYSDESCTGKTTTLQWLSMFIQNDFAVVDDFGNRYNSDWASKRLVSIEFDGKPRSRDVEQMKLLQTADFVIFNEKNIQLFQIKCKLAFITTSQYEIEENRFLNIKMNPVKKPNPMMIEKLRKEVNAFRAFIDSRNLNHKAESRLYFNILKS